MKSDTTVPTVMANYYCRFLILIFYIGIYALFDNHMLPMLLVIVLLKLLADFTIPGLSDRKFVFYRACFIIQLHSNKWFAILDSEDLH